MYGGTFNNPKDIRKRRFMVMNKNSEIYEAFPHKNNFHKFCSSTDDPVLTSERVRP